MRPQEGEQWTPGRGVQQVRETAPSAATHRHSAPGEAHRRAQAADRPVAGRPEAAVVLPMGTRVVLQTRAKALLQVHARAVLQTGTRAVLQTRAKALLQVHARAVPAET